MNIVAGIEESMPCQAALFNIANEINHRRFTIEDIGDFIPGSVMVQDLSTLTNTYMNKSGCEILKHSKEELEDLGPAYFTRFFPPEEMAILKPELFKFCKQNDPSRVYSFFQRVRPNESCDYKWYLTSSSLYSQAETDNNTNIIHIAIEVNNISYASKKMSFLSEQNELVQKNYSKYCLLTSREKEIIKLIIDGKSSYVIADMLFISQHTVNNHRKNIIKKLDIRSLSELFKIAIAFNMI